MTRLIWCSPASLETSIALAEQRQVQAVGVDVRFGVFGEVADDPVREIVLVLDLPGDEPGDRAGADDEKRSSRWGSRVTPSNAMRHAGTTTSSIPTDVRNTPRPMSTAGTSAIVVASASAAVPAARMTRTSSSVFECTIVRLYRSL